MHMQKLQKSNKLALGYILIHVGAYTWTVPQNFRWEGRPMHPSPLYLEKQCYMEACERTIRKKRKLFLVK